MLRRVKGMELSPHACVSCGQGPTDNDGNQQDCIFIEGVDINWGDSVYICESCANLIADLMHRATKEGFDKLTEKYESLVEEHDALLEAHERQEELLEKIREGNKAQREIRSKRKVA